METQEHQMSPLPRFVVAAAALVQAATAQAVVSNGGFETGGFGPWTTTGSVLLVSDSTLRSWGGSGSLPSGGFVVTFGSGNQSATGVVDQFLPTVAGQPYVLAFDYGKFGVVAGAQEIRVVVSDGVSAMPLLNALVVDSTGSLDLGTMLNRFSYGFVAASATTRISFSDTSLVTAATDGVLDNIAVTAVPELPSAPLFLAGLGGLALLRQRVRARQAAGVSA